MAIPDPEPGLVVRFNYLWSYEFERGAQEARYPRPCAIALSYHRGSDGVLMALLAPITHSQPGAENRAIEIPQAVKERLGLDAMRSWVMIDEVNETRWPGYDLQPLAKGLYAYGFVPPVLFRRIRDALNQVVKERRLKRIPR